MKKYCWSKPIAENGDYFKRKTNDLLKVKKIKRSLTFPNGKRTS